MKPLLVALLLASGCLEAAPEDDALAEHVEALGSPICDPAPNPCTQAINCGAWTSWVTCSSWCDLESASCPGMTCYGSDPLYPETRSMQRRRRGCTDPSKPPGQRACQQTQTREVGACGCDGYGPPYCGPI